MGTSDDVRALQATVVSGTQSVFSQMQGVYNGAMARALAQIPTSLNANPSVSESDKPAPGLTLEEAIKYIKDLKAIFLFRPTYPALDSTPPALPTLSTTPPPLSTVTLPTAPSLNMPAFTATLDSETIASPSIEFSYSEIEYLSTLRNVLYNQLRTELTTGGYGLRPDDETRLFERARERELRAGQAAIDGATRLFSSGGFTMPTGALHAALQRAQDGVAEKVSSLNRDLMIERGKMYLEGKKQNQDGVLALEQMDVQRHMAVQDRALKVATQRVTSVLEIAAFQVERIKLFMEKYKVLAGVFEVLVRAEGVKSDIYKTQVEAVKAQIDVGRALLEEFTMRNKALVDVFMASVEAYKAKVDGWSKHIGALADQYKSDAAAYGAATDGYGKAFDAEARMYSSDAEVYAARLSARSSEEQMKLQEEIARSQVELEASKAEVNAAAAIVSAALSAMNVNASMSATASAGASFQGSVEESTSYNHNYQEK